MLKGYYDTKRFRYIHNELDSSLLFERKGAEKIRKTACFYGEKFNVYIDTSDGVNEDLDIYEYCGRMLKVVDDTCDKPFLFFKAAYSPERSKNVVELANSHGGKVIPFFKWSFNDSFYNNIFDKREMIINKLDKSEKEYDIGYFCGLKAYDYPKPSSSNPLVSWTDHRDFNLPGSSTNTGQFVNYSRKFLYDKIINSRFKVLYCKKLNYFDYIKESFKCKVILNPPGIGEYTSRIFDQTYLGNCIVLRKSSYDNGVSWKNHIPEIDFNQDNWENNLEMIINNYQEHGNNCKEYFNSSWTAKAIVNYLTDKIEENYELS